MGGGARTTQASTNPLSLSRGDGTLNFRVAWGRQLHKNAGTHVASSDSKRFVARSALRTETRTSSRLAEFQLTSWYLISHILVTKKIPIDFGVFTDISHPIFAQRRSHSATTLRNMPRGVSGSKQGILGLGLRVSTNFDFSTCYQYCLSRVFCVFCRF